jgi:hypothetical protein
MKTTCGTAQWLASSSPERSGVGSAPHAFCRILVGGIGHHPGALPGRDNAALTEPTSSHAKCLKARNSHQWGVRCVVRRSSSGRHPAEIADDLENATMRLLIIRSNSVGTQIARSPALGVMRLRTRLNTVSATTIHTSQ